MGNGSPRFLRKVVLGGVAALAFTPSAFADNPIGPPRVTTTPVNVSVPSVPATDVSKVAPVQPTLLAQHAIAGFTASAPSHATAPVTPARSPTGRPRRNALLPSSPQTRGVHSRHVAVPTSSRELTATRTSPIANRKQSTPRLPQLPPPRHNGIPAGGGPTTSGVVLLLLFALAAELALLAAPRLGRRLSLHVLPPRPFAYLLELERPD